MYMCHCWCKCTLVGINNYPLGDWLGRSKLLRLNEVQAASSVTHLSRLLTRGWQFERMTLFVLSVFSIVAGCSVGVACQISLVSWWLLMSFGECCVLWDGAIIGGSQLWELKQYWLLCPKQPCSLKVLSCWLCEDWMTLFWSICMCKQIHVLVQWNAYCLRSTTYM